MKTERQFRTAGQIGLLLVAAVLSGCLCPKCDSLTCGGGTMEEMIGGQRTCVLTPITCGTGAEEQPVGGQRECVPAAPKDVLECGTDTHEQEQPTGGQRECVPGTTTCPAGQIEVLRLDGTTFCQSGPLSCAEGTHEQPVGGQRECVLDDSDLSCGSGTQQEQPTGGQRECTPDP